ncbi:unnamed protein product, partial [Schistosoma turkestanicum]
MPILPVSLTRLGSPTTQGLQAHLGLQPILHSTGSLHGSNPYTVVSSSGPNNLGTTGSSLTILFGAPLDRTSTSYTTTPIGTSGSITTPTGVRALAAAAAALASVNSRQVHSVAAASGTTMLALSASSDISGVSTGRSSISVTNIGSTVSTSTSTTTSSGSTATTNTTGSASILTTVSTSVPATGFSTSTTSTNTNAHASSLSTNGSNYGLLDHRTLFKETHPVQSIMISRSGTMALLTIHKM